MPRFHAISTTRTATEAPPRPLSLRKNVSWTLVGNLVYALCQWALITVLAKLGSTEMLGQYSLALAITAPVMMFANLQLRGIQATDTRGDFGFNSYLTLRITTTVLATMVILVIATTASEVSGLLMVIILIGIAKSLDAMSDVFYGYFQQREQMDLVAKSLMVSATLALTFFVAGIGGTGSLIAGACGLMLSSALNLLVIVIPAGMKKLRQQGAKIELDWKLDDLTRLFLTALPLGVVILLISLNANIPKYFMAGSSGAHELGIFSALSYLVIAGNTVVGALGQAVSPRLARLYASGEYHVFRRFLATLVAASLVIGALAAIVSSVIGDDVVTLIYSSEYGKYQAEIGVLAATAGISYAASFTGYGITAARHFRIQVPLFIFVLLVCALSSWKLVPPLGVMGACLTLLLTATAQLTFSMILVHKITRFSGDDTWEQQ